jgi:Tol biopolymer transport system component
MKSKGSGFLRSLGFILVLVVLMVVGVWLTRELNRAPALAAPTAQPATPTPTVAFTPTAINRAAQVLTVAFYREDAIYYWQPGISAQLVRELDGFRPASLWVNPDGTRVFYTLNDSQERGLYSVFIPKGERRLWISNQDIDNLTPDVSSRLDHLDFLPNADALVFNTHPQEGIALQTSENRDLYLLNLTTGEVKTLLPLGTSGVDFSLSPDGQWVALLDTDQIEIMRLDGTGRQTLLAYDPAIPRGTVDYSTYPEYADTSGGFFPGVRWMPDSSGFWVLIPPAEINSEDPGMSRLYQVLVQGETTLLAEITFPMPWDAPLFLSPDGQKFAYFGGSEFGLWIYDVSSGSEDEVQFLESNKAYYFLGWTPDSKYCLIQEETASGLANQSLSLVQPGQPPIRISGFGRWPYPIDWLDDQHFLGYVMDGTLIQLAILGLDGSVTPIGKLSFPLLYDYAAPAP